VGARTVLSSAGRAAFPALRGTPKAARFRQRKTVNQR